ncbi:hypothetical protein VAB18032_23305 [Micromonospora maris AB-18-032]|nr:hypothetical protein VAB18032_23305 [Micromonospora maris AB-18-032]
MCEHRPTERLFKQVGPLRLMIEDLSEDEVCFGGVVNSGKQAGVGSEPTEPLTNGECLSEGHRHE